MPKVRAPRTSYGCTSCGHTELKWLGRCPACRSWSTMVEHVERGPRGGAAPRPSPAGIADGAEPMPITAVRELGGADRIASGIGELDRVLGGGLVPGCLVLLGGDPGVGKSTLLVQALAGFVGSCGVSMRDVAELQRGARDLAAAAQADAQAQILYATGEESVAQTAMRARRVGAATAQLSVVAETDVDRILAIAAAQQPALLAVDSIQTVYTPSLDSIPGSLAQVRECAARLMQFAKTSGTPTIVVGHVTKDGGIAGPKTLEHLVDVVLQLEGDGGPYRVLRAHKNRFGSTQEIGVFEMRGAGMVEVANPSAHLLAERPVGAPGSVVVASADGARPLLVEVQALVAPAMAGIGRRTAAGVDGNRVALLLAVLAQRASCDVLDRDVFVNVAGGLKLSEPAIDLGVACAIASSARGRAIDPHTIVFGELGLAGEVRAVPLCEQRLAEAARLGFRRALIPQQNAARLDRAGAAGMKLVAVDRLSSAIAEL
ncbi:MAG: DNA repair protein RadA [Deltaproteobacteria bacterium]|nr:DNA repair protein RadA [Deltaproteobacteria bacterium]MCW5804560.1 DNA repair protein RadA [Deltaproteobacteria bacterium]